MMVFPELLLSACKSLSCNKAGLFSKSFAVLAKFRNAALSPRARSSAANPSLRALTTWAKTLFAIYRVRKGR